VTPAQLPSDDAVTAFLTDVQGGPDGPAKVIVTHLSKVFLGKDRVLKLKRAVKFPFLDFRSLAARHKACLDEVAINSRFAPDLYKGVVAITQTADGSLALDGDGDVVDYVVDMQRFDEATLFDHLADQPRGLRGPMIESLADEIARLHAEGAPSTTHGGYAGIRMIAENNVQSFKSLDGDVFDPDLVERVTTETLTRIDAACALLDARRDAGHVRRCHGDLHLRNICLWHGKPTLFDGIEFSDDFAIIDTGYDLAFVLMDAQFRGHRRLASMLMNRYLDVADDTPALFRVLPIFLSMRAQIRAHVGAAAVAGQADAQARQAMMDKARAYLKLAADYLTLARPLLVAVGGLSGSGKSRLAREVASYLGQSPGARVVRTDVKRKRLAGIHPNETLAIEGYSAEMTERTYAAFFDEAASAIRAGQCAVLDAVFAMPDQRAQAEALAETLGVSFTGVWVSAPEEVRVSRVIARERNVSDVTADIARGQSDYDIGAVTWAVVDSSGSKEDTIAKGLAVLGGTR